MASFFVSRADGEVDKRLEEIGTDEALALRQGRCRQPAARQRGLSGRVPGTRWPQLTAQGAVPQRRLWASTGVKNPDYSNTVYVTELGVEPSLWWPTRSTRCRSRPCRPSLTTARSRATK